ncbi:MAG: MarR family transcriptional regulator [Thermomicrobiales bacterium]|nr:MarR family transcriptional regulator [Thermomicrobiales bacterium]
MAEQHDAVDRVFDAWMAELPGVDPVIEAVRMRLRRLGQDMNRLLDGIAARHDLTLGDWETLSALRRGGAPYASTPTALARALGVTSGTISVRLERLQRAGLIEPTANPADGRGRPVQLTATGAERWHAATADRTALEARLINEALDPDEIGVLNDLLRRFALRVEGAAGGDHGSDAV